MSTALCPVCDRTVPIDGGSLAEHPVAELHPDACPGSRRSAPGHSGVVNILVTAVDVETGVWCDRCQLPSAVITTGVMTDERTMRLVGRFRWKQCQDCGESGSVPWEAP